MASILNVDSIRNAAGTSALTIDSSGNVNIPGHVVQVVSDTHNRDDGRLLETTSTSYVQGSGLSVTITPKFASSNILIMFTTSIYQNDPNMLCTIFRDGVNVASSYGLIYRYNETGDWQNATANWVEPANTTSAITFTVAGRCTGGGTVYMGGENSYISTLIAMEIAG